MQTQRTVSSQRQHDCFTVFSTSVMSMTKRPVPTGEPGLSWGDLSGFTLCERTQQSLHRRTSWGGEGTAIHVVDFSTLWHSWLRSQNSQTYSMNHEKPWNHVTLEILYHSNTSSCFSSLHIPTSNIITIVLWVRWRTTPGAGSQELTFYPSRNLKWTKDAGWVGGGSLHVPWKPISHGLAQSRALCCSETSWMMWNGSGARGNVLFANKKHYSTQLSGLEMTQSCIDTANWPVPGTFHSFKICSKHSIKVKCLVFNVLMGCWAL